MNRAKGFIVSMEMRMESDIAPNDDFSAIVKIRFKDARCFGDLREWMSGHTEVELRPVKHKAKARRKR